MAAGGGGSGKGWASGDREGAALSSVGRVSNWCGCVG